MNRDALQSLFAGLGETIGLPELKLDDDGYLCIIDDDGVVLNIDHFEDQDCLVLTSTAAEIADEKRLEVYDEMLKANFLWKETAGTTLCVDPSGRNAMLAVSITAGDLDLPKLINVVGHMHALTWAWSERIRAITGEDPLGGEMPGGAAAAAQPDLSQLA
jgi:Tir chaperone protein (CesT) family